MGISVSTISTNFDDCIDPSKRHYPPMTVSVYQNEVLQETFEAPPGFDLVKFAGNKRRIGISLTTSFLINKHDQQGLEVFVNHNRYVGIYKIDPDPNHYISEELRGKPPMIVSVYDSITLTEQFEAPSGFDLDKYATRFPNDRLLDPSNFPQKAGEKVILTSGGKYGHRRYVGVYKKVEEEPDQD
jgi:hypothetical protein